MRKELEYGTWNCSVDWGDPTKRKLWSIVCRKQWNSLDWWDILSCPHSALCLRRPLHFTYNYSVSSWIYKNKSNFLKKKNKDGAGENGTWKAKESKVLGFWVCLIGWFCVLFCLLFCLVSFCFVLLLFRFSKQGNNPGCLRTHRNLSSSVSQVPRLKAGSKILKEE